MVAQTTPLPNLRRHFIPDPGYIIADADLSGADARVVAWEADDKELIAAFEAGLNVHIKNARDIFPSETKGLSDEAIKATDRPGGLYANCKKAVHLTNYGGAAKTLASATGWLVSEAETFQRTWFNLHPAIATWHRTTEHNLASSRSVRNAFGYRIVYFDRIDRLLPEALAWIPQSTVALITAIAAVQLFEQLPHVQLLMQVHDSLVFQYKPSSDLDDHTLILSTLTVPVPYAHPLIIPWNIKTSHKSWGDCG